MNPAGGGVTTSSTLGLPVTSDAFQSTTDGSDFYLMVLNEDAASLAYATFFGGTASEHVDGGTSRFDKGGRVDQAVCAGCGGTFPTTPGAWSSTDMGQNCNLGVFKIDFEQNVPVSYTHLRAHETVLDLVCRLLLEKKKKILNQTVDRHLITKYLCNVQQSKSQYITTTPNVIHLDSALIL